MPSDDCCPRPLHHPGRRPWRRHDRFARPAAGSRVRLGRYVGCRFRERPGPLQRLHAGLRALRTGSHHRGTNTGSDKDQCRRGRHHRDPASLLLPVPADDAIEGRDRVVDALAQPRSRISRAIVKLSEVSHAGPFSSAHTRLLLEYSFV